MWPPFLMERNNGSPSAMAAIATQRSSATSTRNQRSLLQGQGAIAVAFGQSR